ncbi:MAG: M28 family peptidase [Gemmatimonadaceae bacterium]
MTRHRHFPRRVLPAALAVLSCAGVLPRALRAQVPAPPPVPPPTQRAWKSLREADLRRDLFAMAAPEMRGREGGSLDEMRASIWVAEQYARIGLKPMGENGTWFQWFNIVRTRVSPTASAATIGGRSLPVFWEIVANAVAPVEASGTVLWIADAADTTVDVRGRIVATSVVTPPPASVRSTSYPTRVRYAEAAVQATTRSLARRGATAILIVATDSVDAAFDAISVQRARGTYDVDHATPRAAGASDRVAPLPQAGTGPTPSFLVRAAMGEVLRQQPNVALSIRLERFEVPSVNVIGGIRGTDSALRDEWVLYSSHQDANGVRLLEGQDSVLAGADDNASVSVAEFAAARAMVAQRPRRSVIWVHHGSEERGLLGSRYHSAHPVIPINQIVAVLNGDMIGRNHPDTAALLGSQPPHRGSTDLVNWALAANAKTGKFVIDTLWDRPTHPEGWYFRSDHLPYARLGVPGLMYTTNLHPDYHTAFDIPERIDYPKLLRMTQWMYLTGWYAANAPKRPAVDSGFKLER